MKIREMITMDIDVDVYDDVTDEVYCAFVGPTYMTKEGESHFAKVLDLEVELNDDCAIVLIDQYRDYASWEVAVGEFFNAVAGYCPSDLWDAWFTYEAPAPEGPVFTITIKNKNTYEAWELTVDADTPQKALLEMLGKMI